MNVVIIVILIVGVIILVGGLSGRIIKKQNSQRSESVAVPDEPLNNLHIYSKVAEYILGSLLDDDPAWYRTHFSAFLLTHLKDTDGDTKDPETKIEQLTNTIKEYENYAINTEATGGTPSAIFTLIRAEELDGRVGAAVQNAIIYALAACIASDAKSSAVKDAIATASSLPEANRDKKSPDMHRTDMIAHHPRAAAIAEKLGHLESQKVARDVVIMMDYLIELGIDSYDSARS